MTDRFRVVVLGPHASGALVREVLDGVEVHRYRYAPQRWETLVNDGGIITNLRRGPWRWLLIPGFLLSMVWNTWALVRRLSPAVVHAHWLIPQGLIAATLRTIVPRMPPFVVTSHGADLFALRGRLLQAFKRFVCARAAAATVVSRAMREELTRIGVDPANVSVQPMGVDLQYRFTPDSRVPRSHSEILFVGRLVEKKGLRFLIDAMPKVIAHHPDAFLTVAGFGPEEPRLREQVGRLGLAEKVRFLGAVRQADLPALYRRAAVFAAPFVRAHSGDREGLGLVSVEAAGCGCRVVVSRLPAVYDVFAEGEATFAEPGDAASLANALISSLGTARSEPLPSRETLLARFDWQVIANNYSRILEASCDR
jgi:glycosyltransferase involved in cell wall biosynthesis